MRHEEGVNRNEEESQASNAAAQPISAVDEGANSK